MPIILDPEYDALGIVDVQPAFMPGGSLPTPDGDAVIAPINRLLAAPFRFRFGTQDWHPALNVTFASCHADRKVMESIDTDHGSVTLWPDHAIMGTQEAELHPKLDAHLFDVIKRKGDGVNLEGYSAFSDLGRQIRSNLAATLRDQGINRVFLAGLALDVCVAATAEDAVLEGFKTIIVEDACRASEPETVPQLKKRLEDLAVLFVQERDVFWMGSSIDISHPTSCQ